jgi:predicted RNA-binding protein YlqC (UPF0109 family)
MPPPAMLLPVVMARVNEPTGAIARAIARALVSNAKDIVLRCGDDCVEELAFGAGREGDTMGRGGEGIESLRQMIPRFTTV